MKYYTEIYQLPFNAILAGTKKFELRSNTSYEKIDYRSLKTDDQIEFKVIAGPPFVNFDVINNQRLVITIGEIKHFSSARALFEQEGYKWCSFEPNSIEEAIDWIHQILEYKTSIPLYGIYAFEIKKATSYLAKNN
jgi:ASC-1-like (ASCH) protein